MFFLLFYVFFDVEFEYEARFGRSPQFLSYKNNVLDNGIIYSQHLTFYFEL